MDDRALRSLEFDKVKALLAEHAHWSLGRELCLALTPATDVREVRRRQQETTEARRLLRDGSSPPFGGIHDIREAVTQSAMGVVLEPVSLLDAADTIYGATRLKKYLLEQREDAPELAQRAGLIGNFRSLEEEIRQAITDKAEVADNASPDLRDIRRKIQVGHSRVREKLDQFVRSSEGARVLQDPIVTLRNDRFVVPVKQEYRAQVPGIVHDSSASGATLFIEPMAVVELNNELRELEAAEREEVLRILRRLSARVGQQAAPLQETLQQLGELDCIVARAALSSAQDAVEPELNMEGRYDIRRGRHPLLRGEVVPVDVHLGKSFDTMVITGPNTGGKTVTLKLLGLFTLMAQAGLHVPAGRGTELAVVAEVLVDVGDEQSIEQSLSTFSAHMTNVVRILKRVREEKAGRGLPLAGKLAEFQATGSLVLLDEVGAGTDPAEGAALAMAILEYLYEQGARTVATTHYSELKTFAYARAHVENASVEFNVETLRPTYRLLIGLPGRSNAFEISGRLGLQADVVDRARQFLTKEDLKAENLIRSMEETRRALEAERDETAIARREAQRLREELLRERHELTDRRGKLLDEARQEAVDLVAQARREADAVIRELRQPRQETDQERAAEQARRQLDEARKSLQAARQQERVQQPEDVPADLKTGEPVFIVSLDQKGHVLAPPDSDGMVLVQAGILKIKVRLSDLRRAAEDAVTLSHSKGFHAGGAGAGRGSRSSAGALAQAKAMTLSPEVDLRGLMVDEAVDKTDKYLDDAALAGLRQVRIIHGKGTGALRQAIREFLHGHRLVVGYRLGEPAEGGDGVTVANLVE
ncbi:MAG: endonuclease MutS2 [Symbiobacteriia bacterium]